MLVRLLSIASLVLFVTGLSVPAFAQNACEAGKLKCARNKLGCLIKVYEVASKKGLPPDATKLQKCMDKFDGGAIPSKGCFAALEAKFGGACTTTGDTSAIEAMLDGDVDALLSALGVGGSTTVTTSSSTTTTSTVGGSTTSTTVLLAQGTPCSAANQCATGFCVDGVCCESACTGLCRSCSGNWNNLFTDGVCAPIEVGDPDNECASTSICCNGLCSALCTL